jgi:hypothetical protein
MNGETMNKKTYFGLACLFLLLTLNSCTFSSDKKEEITSTPSISEDQTQLSTNVACAFETISPANVVGEVVNFSGDSPKNQKFSLKSGTTIRVYWNQISKGNFLLSGTNLDPNLVTSPERKIIFESYVGPSSGCVDATLSAGDYQIDVEKADSSWKVWVQTISYKK